MRTTVVIIGAVIVLSLSVYGCKGKKDQTPNAQTSVESQAVSEVSDGYQPTETRVIDEFKNVWLDVHGEKGEKGSNWLLVKTEVGDIRVDKAAKTATVNIKYTYKPGTKPERTKAADFLFHETSGSWEIDKDTAKYPITP